MLTVVLSFIGGALAAVLGSYSANRYQQGISRKTALHDALAEYLAQGTMIGNLIYSATDVGRLDTGRLIPVQVAYTNAEVRVWMLLDDDDQLAAAMRKGADATNRLIYFWQDEPLRKSRWLAFDTARAEIFDAARRISKRDPLPYDMRPDYLQPSERQLPLQ